MERRRAWKLLLIPLFAVTPLLLGALRLRLETDPALLWSAGGARLEALKNTYECVWGDFPQQAGVIFEGGAGRDMLSSCGFLAEVLRFQEEMRASFEGVCSRPEENGGCLWFSPGMYWGNSVQNCEGDYMRHGTITQSWHKSPLGIPLQKQMVFGGINMSGVTVRSVRSMRLLYVLNGASNTTDWEHKLLALAARFNANSTSLFATVAGNTPSSLQEASTSSLEADWWLPVVGVALTLLVILVALVIMSGCRGLVYGGVSFLIVVLSVACAVGFTSLLGVAVNPVTAQIVTILVLAVSSDSLFVILGLTREEDAKHALRVAGPSLVVAIATLVATFAASLFDMTAAGVSVTITVAASFVLLCVLQLLCLPALMVLLPPPSRKDASISMYARLVRFLHAHTVLRVIVLFLFFAVAGAAIYGTTRLQYGIDTSVLAPVGSNAALYERVQKQEWGGLTAVPYYWSVVSPSFNKSSTQDLLQTVKTKLMGDAPAPLSLLVPWIKYRQPAKKRIWDAAGHRIPEELFVPWLREFLNTTGALLQKDVLFDTNDNMHAFRVLGSASGKDIPELAASIKVLLTDGVRSNANYSSAPWSPVIPLFTQFIDLSSKAMTTLGVGVGALALMSLVFFYPLIDVSLVHILCVCMVLVDFLAIMTIIDVQLNSITLLSAVSGCGLASEYMLQILQLYRERGRDMVDASNRVGVSLMTSVLASCVGMVVLLIFSSSLVIKLYFAAMWLAAFIIGGLHAFFFAPLLLRHRPRVHDTYKAINVN